MTNDEAIAIIHNEYKCVDRDCDIERSCGKCDLMMPSKEPILEAYKLAIKALEQQPCDDAISRQAAIDAMYALCDTGGTLKENPWRDNPHIDAVTDVLNTLPPVTPQPKTGHWINGDCICPCCGEDKFKDLDADIWSDWQPKYYPNCEAKMESDNNE